MAPTDAGTDVGTFGLQDLDYLLQVVAVADPQPGAYPPRWAADRIYEHFRHRGDEIRYTAAKVADLLWSRWGRPQRFTDEELDALVALRAKDVADWSDLEIAFVEQMKDRQPHVAGLLYPSQP